MVAALSKETDRPVSLSLSLAVSLFFSFIIFPSLPLFSLFSFSSLSPTRPPKTTRQGPIAAPPKHSIVVPFSGIGTVHDQILWGWLNPLHDIPLNSLRAFV